MPRKAKIIYQEIHSDNPFAKAVDSHVIQAGNKWPSVKRKQKKLIADAEKTSGMDFWCGEEARERNSASQFAQLIEDLVVKQASNRMRMLKSGGCIFKGQHWEKRGIRLDTEEGRSTFPKEAQIVDEQLRLRRVHELLLVRDPAISNADYQRAMRIAFEAGELFAERKMKAPKGTLPGNGLAAAVYRIAGDVTLSKIPTADLIDALKKRYPAVYYRFPTIKSLRNEVAIVKKDSRFSE